MRETPPRKTTLGLLVLKEQQKCHPRVPCVRRYSRRCPLATAVRRSFPNRRGPAKEGLGEGRAGGKHLLGIPLVWRSRSALASQDVSTYWPARQHILLVCACRRLVSGALLEKMPPLACQVHVLSALSKLGLKGAHSVVEHKPSLAEVPKCRRERRAPNAPRSKSYRLHYSVEQPT